MLPRLLSRRLAVLFSVICATSILSVVAAFSPLFRSSSSSAALQRDLEGRCPDSIAANTTLLTLIGVVSGIFAARLAAESLYRALDAAPETPPGIALAVAAIAAILAQRTGDGADTSELLRHGD